MESSSEKIETPKRRPSFKESLIEEPNQLLNKNATSEDDFEQLIDFEFETDVKDETFFSSDHCGLVSQLFQKPYEKTVKDVKEKSQDNIENVKLVKSVIEQVVRKATKPERKHLKKKVPKIKFGWMKLSTKIPDFYIDDETFKNIMFNENLLISTFGPSQSLPTPVGALSLNIEEGRGGPLKYKDQNKNDHLCSKFLVHLSSHFDFMGHGAGSRMTAWVDRGLQTLEEKRREYVQLDDELDQQCLYVSSQENYYYLRHDKKKDIFYSPQKAENLICEGANFILMRYMAIKKLVGIFEVTTLYIDGNLCRNIYDCKGPSSGMVNDVKLDVCKIYRTIIEQCGIEHKSVTLLTLDGRILKQEWHSSEHILQINPMIRLNKEGKEQRTHLEDKEIGEDLEILSLYLDKKVLTKKVIQNYMENSPEIRDLLSDYVQTLLHLKPEDVFEFTAKYFLSFTPHLLPQSEYYERPFDADEDDDYEFWRYL